MPAAAQPIFAKQAGLMSWQGALDFDAGSEAGTPVSGQSGQQSDMFAMGAAAAAAIGGGPACAVV